MAKKIKMVELQYVVEPKVLERFALDLKQDPKQQKIFFSCRYIAEDPDTKNKELLNKAKKAFAHIFATPAKINIHSESLEESITDAKARTTTNIQEEYFGSESEVRG